MQITINKFLDYVDSPEDSFQEYIEKAIKYKVRAIYANQFQVKYAQNILRKEDVIIAGAIDFPLGKSTIAGNIADIEYLYSLGIREIDYVLNQYAIENADFTYIEKQMKTIKLFCEKHNITDKCIVEMCKLSEKDKIIICEIASNVQPRYLKTSTGMSYGGARIEDVALMRSILPDNIKIKASGGISNLQFANELISAGADVLGASAAIEIIKEAKQKTLYESD